MRYRDRIRRVYDTAESLVGTLVHDVLQKCYQDVSRHRLVTLEELQSYYDYLWQKKWHEGVVIHREGYTPPDYRQHGWQMLADYYRRFAPFDQDVTLSTEKRVSIRLDETDRYQLVGFIDRLARHHDGTWEIHDYKTSAHLPSQPEADADRQLALYQLGVRQLWPDADPFRLIWHYLAFQQEVVSSRSAAELTHLTEATMSLIDEIEAAEDFPAVESSLCDWCEYPDLCPYRKHLYLKAALPESEREVESGASLVDRYAELKKAAEATDKELNRVKAALAEYARKENLSQVFGSRQRAKLRFSQGLRFPRKGEAARRELEDLIREAGLWDALSQLDTAKLGKTIAESGWDESLSEQIIGYSRLEETVYVSLSKPENPDEPEEAAEANTD